MEGYEGRKRWTQVEGERRQITSEVLDEKDGHVSDLHGTLVTRVLVGSWFLTTLNHIFMGSKEWEPTPLRFRTRYVTWSKGVPLIRGREYYHWPNYSVVYLTEEKGQRLGVRGWTWRTLMEGLFDERKFGNKVTDEDLLRFGPVVLCHEKKFFF